MISAGTPLSSVKPLALAVFVGTRGRGSNLMALHNAVEEGRLSARIVRVVGAREDAPAVIRAREEGLPIALADPRSFFDDTGYANALLALLKDSGADTIALAGYLRRVPSPVVAAFRHRIVNIHPALLPSFGGKGMYGEHVHRAVLEYGAKVSGCTVHFVDEAYDTGPVIVQRTVSVEEGDTPATLAARILPQEHAAYSDALQLLAEDRLRVEGRVVRVLAPRQAPLPPNNGGF